jgi:SAM-dependent methyltransferase
MHMKNSPGSPDIESNYYDNEYYKKHVQRITSNDRFTQVKVRRVMQLLRPRAHEWILDLGCGAGTMMIMLGGTGARLLGIDYSPHSLKISRDQYTRHQPGSVFRGICCDGRHIAVRDGGIHGIMAVDFTEHLDDTFLEAMVKEAHRILVPGGRFVIYTPNPDHLFEQLKKRNIILKEDKSHIGLRPMVAYLDMLRRYGFHIDLSFFEPTHIPLFQLVEMVLMRVPGIGPFARRRICIRASKPG